MKRFRKIFMGVAIFCGVALSGIVNSSKAFAAICPTCSEELNDKSYCLVCSAYADVTPPQGLVTVEGATLKDGIFYTDTSNVTLRIEVFDEVTTPENIEMMLSNGPIKGKIALNDEKWEPYSETKTWILDPSDENFIYLYLKDEADNIAHNIVLDMVSTYTVTYVGEGKNMPAPKTSQLGMLFNVAIQQPTLEGKYFIGWSETEGGSVQWLSDSVMESKYIKGDKTLYAVYSDEPPTLASQVEIGDYVNYPVAYENVYTEGDSYQSSYKGWRVLDIDGNDVTLVSAGTPLKCHCSTNNVQMIENLLSIDESSGDCEIIFEDNGFRIPKLDLAFDNEFTASVTSMTKGDIDRIVGEITRANYDIAKFGSLLHNDTWYWLGTSVDGKNVWYVLGDEGVVHSTNNTKGSYGVRTKVFLVPGIKTAGRNVSGVWQLQLP